VRKEIGFLVHFNTVQSITFKFSAKAVQRQREEVASSSASSSALNATDKRPRESDPIPKALKRDSRLGTYYDYDLSKMVNSKGGFLVEENGKEVDETMNRKEKQRERQRMLQAVDQRKFLRAHHR
jgi:DNA-repair protein complementing XP-A cells